MALFLAPPIERNDELLTAPVTMKEAVAIAEERMEGFVNEAELERIDNRLVWTIDLVTAGRKLYTMRIDGKNGAILKVERENTDD